MADADRKMRITKIVRGKNEKCGWQKKKKKINK